MLEDLNVPDFRRRYEMIKLQSSRIFQNGKRDFFDHERTPYFHFSSNPNIIHSVELNLHI